MTTPRPSSLFSAPAPRATMSCSTPRSAAGISTSSARPAPARARCCSISSPKTSRPATGIALLDPHGDLAEAVLEHVPRDRTNDFVYINPGRCRAADRLQSPVGRARRPQADRRRWRRLGLPARLAGELGAAARLHPHQRRARVAGCSRRNLADAAPPADRRTVSRAARRAPCRRSRRAVVLAQRICRLWRQLSRRGDLADPEQDRQGAHGAALAQHAGAAKQHDHLPPADGRRRDRHLQSVQRRARRKHRASARRAASPRRSRRPRCRAPTFRPRNGERSISMPTNSNRSRPRALR